MSRTNWVARAEQLRKFESFLERVHVTVGGESIDDPYKLEPWQRDEIKRYFDDPDSSLTEFHFDELSSLAEITRVSAESPGGYR